MMALGYVPCSILPCVSSHTGVAEGTVGVAEGDDLGSGVDDGDGVSVGVPVGVEVADGIGEGSAVEVGRLGSRVSCCGIAGVTVSRATFDVGTAAERVADVGLASIKPQPVCSNITRVVSASVFENSCRPFSTEPKPPDLACASR
jgi:hypothetical protein